MSQGIESTAVSGHPYQQWVTNLKNLDQAAWDVLLRHYAADLRHDILISLRKRDLPDELVDDIEQETWLTAVRKMAEFTWENEEKFYHWLRAISLNHIRTYRRVMGQHLSLDDLGDSETDEELKHFAAAWSIGTTTVEDTIILREQLAALDRAMRQLKPRDREIVMRWWMGETPRELALSYQIKPRSISMLLLRAKGKIEANLVDLKLFQNKDRRDD